MANSRPSLLQLGKRYGSDKFVGHDYADFYSSIFSSKRNHDLTILEIGIGEEGRFLGGASLLTWADYFPKSRIVGIDIFDKSDLDTDRIFTRVCDQSDHEKLEELSAEFGPFDIIIDDGSHIGRHVTRSLFTLFPHMVPGGLYVLEDLQTSYWPGYGGSSLAPHGCDTAIRWIKFAIDIINRSEILFDEFYPLTSGFEIDKLIVQHNIAVLRKSSGPKPVSLVLNDNILENYRREDERVNGARHKPHQEILANPEKFAILLDRISQVGGLDEAIRQLSK